MRINEKCILFLLFVLGFFPPRLLLADVASAADDDDDDSSGGKSYAIASSLLSSSSANSFARWLFFDEGVIAFNSTSLS